MTRRTTRRTLARFATVALLLVSASGPAIAFELPSRDGFDAMVQRPLFFPSRRAAPTAAEAAPQAAAPTVSAPAEGMRLIGVAVDPQARAIAVLRATAGSERRVSVGDVVQGWTIDAIGRGGLSLSAAGQRVSVPVLGMVPTAPDKPTN